MGSKNLSNILYLVISGLGVGWIVGLSISPVVHIVLGSILALVVSLASAIAGVEKLEEAEEQASAGKTGPIAQKVARVRLDPRPIALLVLGLAIGSSIGAYARTNDWLGENPRRVVDRWKGAGLDEAEIRMRLFNDLYPQSSVARDSNSEHPVSPGLGVLFATGTTDCGNIRLKHGQALWAELRQLKNGRVDAFLKVSRDSLAMEALKEFLCAQEK